VQRCARGFERVIARYRTRADSQSVTSVNRLLARIQSATKSRGAVAVHKLGAALGLSSL
jgi:hypothetical protein